MVRKRFDMVALLVEYVGFPEDQPCREKYVAARLQRSCGWLQEMRVRGRGPVFYRTESGKIYYIKRDVEDYLVRSMKRHERTGEYV